MAVDMSRQRMDSRLWYPSLCILNFLMLGAHYTIGVLTYTAPNEVIYNKLGYQIDKYPTQITPAGWTFYIWVVIYVWQAFWVIYSIVNICRGSTYRNPKFLPSTLFLFNTFALACGIAWLMLFDRDQVIIAFGLLFAYTLFLYGALAASYAALDKATPSMIDEGRTPDIWLTRALVHNSLGLQAGWVSVVTVLYAAMVMAYKGDPPVDQITTGTVALSILSGMLLIFTIVDFLGLDRYSRYTLTPHIGIIVHLAGSIYRNWEAEARNSIFSAGLLSVACLLFLVKLILSAHRHFSSRQQASRRAVSNEKASTSRSTGKRQNTDTLKKAKP